MSEHIEKGDHGDQLGFERLVFFSDAVMAIAITLMALEIRVPELEPELAAEQIGAALRSLVPHIAVYVLSFLVIGIYWVVHHRLFRQIKHYNISVLWLNLLFLMAVAFLPVATNALGNYSGLPEVQAFYSISIALVGLTEFALWLYLFSRGYLARPAERYSNLYFALRILVPPIVFLLSIPVSFLVSPDLARYFWALIVPALLVLAFIFRREHAERELFAEGEAG